MKPVSEPLQPCIRFFPDPLPAWLSLHLTVELPFREPYGLTMFRMSDRIGLGLSSIPAAFMPMTGENGAPVPTATRTLSASLDPSWLTILMRFAYADLTIHPSSDPR
ncbi:hypothetical protein FEI13_04985 [Halomonas urmiana]|uniref:Uncharacterized protein n=1 Tax=Halomonas urmiana TaxID=490901 RepID=A0A5R8MN14_9GAMM|nr:hypothetical protein FEI13_04985 [Halomonas urmiana]